MDPFSTGKAWKFPSLVPTELCEQVAATAEQHRATRGGPPQVGMVNVFHQRPQWEVRQLPALYEAFVEVVGTEKLWVRIDRVGIKPSGSDSERSRFVHWDVLPEWAPAARGRGLRAVQGVLYLRDVAVDQGPFCCVPELLDPETRRLHLEAGGVGVSPYQDQMLTGTEPTPVPGGAGDLIVWDYDMAHGQMSNTSGRERHAMYITMRPAGSEDERRALARCVAGGEQPEWWCDAGREPLDREPSPVGWLSELGRKLAGLDPW